ncbi:carboxypeptidase-like regulatory domain-containing protein [Arenibacter latericius]|uniref:carboxypeptidase-like regulatory domain-containing protein n=1 Tax=Arenibacter latericius TaxID=86104 RepID=UPI000422E4CE|nr:carboxypeptidase-like regulatory domain-containing protein [Arenibacter latericius]
MHKTGQLSLCLMPMGIPLKGSIISRNLSLVCLLLVNTAVFSQTFGEKKMEGKVYSSDGDVAATHVLNTTTRKAAITDVEGFFTIGVHLNDTLVFSAVQYRKKTMVVTADILESKFISVALEEANIALDEVVVTPYNLTGDLTRDMKRLNIPPPVTASSLGLPNAHVKPLSQSERLLREASMGPITLGTFTSIPFNPLINAISGRTKMLKKRVARDKDYARTERVKRFYPDSIFVQVLKIPEDKLDDFLYFCEIDAAFAPIVDTHDKLKIWDYLKGRSVLYRREN